MVTDTHLICQITVPAVHQLPIDDVVAWQSGQVYRTRVVQNLHRGPLQKFACFHDNSLNLFFVRFIDVDAEYHILAAKELENREISFEVYYPQHITNTDPV
jgi:hypothetical protein